MIATATYEELSREELVIKVTELTERLHQLERLVFGSKHERFAPTVSADQLALDISTQQKEQSTPELLQTIQYQRKKASKSNTEKVQTGRMPLPASLPREQVIIEPTVDVTGWTSMGSEITEELERTPGKLFVRQYLRSKYVNPLTGQIVIGELPVRPIDKGIAGPGLLAQIVSDTHDTSCANNEIYCRPGPSPGKRTFEIVRYTARFQLRKTLIAVMELGLRS